MKFNVFCEIVERNVSKDLVKYNNFMVYYIIYIIYIYKALCESVSQSVCPLLFVPGGQTICLSPGGQTFSVTQGGTNKLFVPPVSKKCLSLPVHRKMFVPSPLCI